jgi:uncharacterized protein (UPF0332 family)
MNYDDLIREGRLRQAHVDSDEIRAHLSIVERDIRLSQTAITQDLDWAFVLAYNSILQACLGLVYAKGYIPRGMDKHKTIIEFATIALGDEYKIQMNKLSKIRHKRHKVLYQVAGLIGEQEAKNTIAFAEEIVPVIKDEIFKLIGY